MGETIIEKIIRHNTGKAVKPGDIVTVNVDRCMIHDIFIPFVADKFEEMGFTKLHDPDKVVLIYDHLVPASQQDDTRHFHKGDEFVEKYGLTHVHRSDGICHQLMTEAGYVKPGDIAFGTDSHTTTYGCVGAFSSGIGYTEMASILGTGTMWIKVPETIKVVIDGELPENVMSKDIILRLIGDLRADGATYRALEFSGSTIENMSVASRMTMANMAIEAGAKCALFTPDEKTAEYCEIELNDYQKSLVGDEDAVYMKTMTYKAEDFVKLCDSFNIPVVTLVNIKGFAATVKEEKTISKAVAKLTYAYANATVPKVTVMLDKAYGTAYTVMCSKAIGADVVFAWPKSVIGTMDPEMAVKIMYEDEIAAAGDKLAYIKEKKAEYTDALSGAVSAARRGYVDDIIEPDATRKRVIAALDMLFSKSEDRPFKKHGTI